MKPVLFNTYYKKGGAAKAVLRLYEALKKHIPDTMLFTQQRNKKSRTTFFSPWVNPLVPIQPYLDFAAGYAHTYTRNTYFPAKLTSNLLYRQIEKAQPDIVHFNWMQGGYMDFAPEKIPSRPVVWTLHDFWPITGGCSYPGECERLFDRCGNCPLFRHHTPNDLSYRVFQRKQAFFDAHPDLQIIAPSTWLRDTLIKSPITQYHTVTVIPNGIDTTAFVPLEKNEARNAIQANREKTIILFGAMGATSNPLKGFDLLLEGLSHLDSKSFQLIVFGSTTKLHKQKFSIIHYPYIHNHRMLNYLYSAADVMVVPSRQEVFGQTVTEALACGTAVVAFNTNGPADLITHLKNGFLASPFSTESLAEGIQWVLNNNPEALGKNARKHCVENFDSSIIAQSHIQLYNKLLKN